MNQYLRVPLLAAVIVVLTAACHTGHPVIVTSPVEAQERQLLLDLRADAFTTCVGGRPDVWIRAATLQRRDWALPLIAHEMDHVRVLRLVGCENGAEVYDRFKVEIEASGYCAQAKALLKTRPDVRPESLWLTTAVAMEEMTGIEAPFALGLMERHCEWQPPEEYLQ